MTGYHILGSTSPDRVITIRVKNAVDLARGQSATASGLSKVSSWIPGAQPAADSFIEGQTYEAIAQKISESLAAQKAVAEIHVIDGSGIVPNAQTYFSLAPKAPSSVAPEDDGEVWKFAKTYKWGFVAGAGLTGIAGLVWHFFFRKAA